MPTRRAGNRPTDWLRDATRTRRGVSCSSWRLASSASTCWRIDERIAGIAKPQRTVMHPATMGHAKACSPSMRSSRRSCVPRDQGGGTRARLWRICFRLRAPWPVGTDVLRDLGLSDERQVPPRRFERLLPAPEAGALSTELRGLTRTEVYHRHERLTSSQDRDHRKRSWGDRIGTHPWKKQDLRLVVHICFVAVYLTSLLPSPLAERGWG